MNERERTFMNAGTIRGICVRVRPISWCAHESLPEVSLHQALPQAASPPPSALWRFLAVGPWPVLCVVNDGLAEVVLDDVEL